LAGGPYAYGIQLARSTDHGANWDPLGWLHDDTSPTEHGFVSLVPTPDGVQAYWLDGRAMVDSGPMSLRTAHVGTTIGPATVVDDRVCDCCATGAAQGPDGLVVAWRDRSDDEIRDISLSVDGEIRKGSDDGWSIAGCPVNGPSVAGSPEATVVGWYSGANETPQVWVAFVSESVSESVGEPGLEDAILIDGTNPVGRVDIVLVSPDEAVVTWLDKQDDQGIVRARRVARDGRLGAVVDLGQTAPGRAAGFPQGVRVGDDLVWAWTLPGPEKTYSLVTERRAIASLPALEALVVESTSYAANGPATRPALTGTTLDGQPFSMDDLQGKPVLINIWASWCGPCVAELPQLAALSERYPELMIVGVAVDLESHHADVQGMVERFGLNYPIVHQGGEAWASGQGVRNVPVTWLYGESGELVWEVSEGFEVDSPTFQAALEEVLEEVLQEVLQKGHGGE
jgi:thiol-disulfide isomerase/thioredoxin